MIRLPRVFYSIMSQGVVSGTNLLLSFALLYRSPSADYVAFLLFVNAFSLLSSLLNALFVSPVGVLIPRMEEAQVARTERIASRLALGIGVAAVPFSVFLTAGPLSKSDPVLTACVTFVAAVLLLQREIARNACMVRGDLSTLLRFDTIYFLFAVGVGVATVLASQLHFLSAVLALSVPALLTMLSRPSWRFSRQIRIDSKIVALDRAFWKQVIKSAKWAVPGVVVTWLFSYGYWFMLERMVGVLAVAELGAARLFFTPVGLIVQGWVMMLRPVAINMAHSGRSAELRVTVMRQSAIGVACVVAVTAFAYCIVVLFPAVLPASMRAPSIPAYLGVWGIYFAVFWVRSGMTVVLLTDSDAFRKVFKANLLVCVAFYAVVLITSRSYSVLGCLWGLVSAELLMIALLLRQFNE